MTQITLKNYQQEAVKTVFEEFKKKTRRQLISLPTGTGKTMILAAIAKEKNQKTLVLAHTEELIQQIKEDFLAYWPDVDIGICKAERNQLDHKIVIGSVQTCSKSSRLKQLKKKGFRILLIDEAHHSAATTYQKIIALLGFGKNKNKLLVGVTATPERSDKKGLSDIFDKIVFSRSIESMIQQGHLVQVHGRKILTSITLDNVKTHHGDFESSSLAHAVNIPERNRLIVDKYIEHAIGRKAIAFCVNVKHCQELAADFNQQGISAAAVWGSMEKDERASILQRFKNNEIQLLTSCGILTEGYNERSVSCIIMARPTKSKPLYTQCVGRGLRLFPGKVDCLVLDFSDTMHNLNSIITLSDTIPHAVIVQDGKNETCATEEISHAHEKSISVVEIFDEKFDLFEQKQFVWIPLGDDEYSLCDDNNKEIVVRPLRSGFVADLYVDHKYIILVQDPLPLEDCFMRCEGICPQPSFHELCRQKQSMVKNIMQ